jgi:hypothetical protein
MRKGGASSQSTCWYVDLLWRAHQQDRAEQVWKTVRSNRKLAGVEEADLLEARFLIRNGEAARAETMLTNATPRGGTLQVERALLLAWLRAERGQVKEADAWLREAENGPYPTPILQRWRTFFHRYHVEPVTSLWRSAVQLQHGEADGQRWRSEVRKLCSRPYLAGPAQALLVQEAGLRGDAAALAELLEEPQSWKAFPTGPPDLVVRTVESAYSTDPGGPLLRRAIARWLETWPMANLGPAARRLALRVGLFPANPETDPPPPETPRVAWFLHQASLAVARDNPIEAMCWVQRALQDDPNLQEVGTNAELVRQAVLELERKAQLKSLAEAVRFDPLQTDVSADVLAGALDVLQADPAGREVLAAVATGDLLAARERLKDMAQRDDLSQTCAHHLALFFYRTALVFEDHADGKTADSYWRLAWSCWLRVLAPAQTAALEASPRFFLARLFDTHRRLVHDFLSGNAIEDARRHWSFVECLPAMAGTAAPALKAEVVDCVARFREDLATDSLTATREVLKQGTASVGWRANYDEALQFLRRLLSLNSDSVRLLTAVVDICGDWFLDCYNNEDPQTIREQLGRYYPFALKLARLADTRPQEFAARAAVAEFYKFRGLMAPNQADKMAIYREALRFDPENANVRELLAGLEARKETS